jgi:hypothetical protein
MSNTTGSLLPSALPLEDTPWGLVLGGALEGLAEVVLGFWGAVAMRVCPQGLIAVLRAEMCVKTGQCFHHFGQGLALLVHDQ